MSYHDRLQREIHTMLDDLATEQKPWIAKWIAHAICNDHAEGLTESDHTDFWSHCGYRDCREEVRKCINKRAGDRPDMGGKQETLFGYDHLQAYYIVKRDGDEMGVPVHELTDEEIDAKAATYRTMAAACYAHADELDKFRRERQRSEAA